MSYTAWSVVAFEQPTAAKWNQLGENDAGFKDGTNFDDDIIMGNHIADDQIEAAHLTAEAQGFLFLKSTTLESSGASISVTSIPARTYLMIIARTSYTGGTGDAWLRFNNDSGNNYAFAISANGAADGSATSTSRITIGRNGVATSPRVSQYFTDNIAANEKLGWGHCTSRETAGAANLQRRSEFAGKWANTSAQITRVDVVNDGAGSGSFDVGSEVLVFGHD